MACEKHTTNRSREEGVKGVTKKCLRCANGFVPKRVAQQYCGLGCANTVNGSKTKVWAVCKQCGNRFHPKHYSRISFCSRECFFAHCEHKRAPVFARIYLRRCRVCESDFVARRKDALDCSEICKREHNRRRAAGVVAAEYSARQRLECTNCGKLFSPVRRRKYCSNRCGHAASKRTRKARKRSGKRCEPVSVKRLMDRDGKNCYICGRPIDFKMKVPGDKAVTVDHLIPIALGGAHTMENVRLAHFICNVIKNDGALNRRVVADCKARILNRSVRGPKVKAAHQGGLF